MRHSTAYGSFSVEPMPGQPQIGLCHSFFVPIKMRGKGHAHKLKTEQRSVLRENHFDFALCTVAGDNGAQQAVLHAAGWEMLKSFENSRTGGITQVWGNKVGAQP